MSGFTGQDGYYSSQGQFNIDAAAFEQPNQQFDFQTYNDQQSGNYNAYVQRNYLDPMPNAYSGGDMYAQDDFTKGINDIGEDDEPPLLEELGIDPDRILQKTLAVLNPFHRRGQIDDANYLLQDADLAGPVAFCLVFAAFLLFAGSKAHFGYVYGLAVTSCLMMYILLSLMSSTGNITLSSVASILGYCLLPVVGLAGLSVFVGLRGPIGLILAAVTVAWAAISASRLFSTMSGEDNQRLLIAYPCFLLYGVFTVIVIF